MRGQVYGYFSKIYFNASCPYAQSDIALHRGK